MTQGHSATLLIYRALPGDAFPHSNLHLIQATHLPSQRDKPGRWKGGLAGDPTPRAAGLPHLGVAPRLLPPVKGPRRKQLGLKSDQPGLVWFHFTAPPRTVRSAEEQGVSRPSWSPEGARDSPAEQAGKSRLGP